MTPSATGFLYDPRFLLHDPGAGHPESAARLEYSYDYLTAQPWYPSLIRIEPKAAAEEWVRSVHSAGYILHAEDACRRAQAYLDTMDVGICEKSFEVALLAAGGALEMADRIVSGRIRNGFALLRPPGHHAEESRAMGFCLFNNVAITARYLQKRHGLDKILILDWDVHHGNGTQHLFEEDPSVLYISLHQYPFYPGTGAFSETGVGRGEGATLNCPMPAGSGDMDYEGAFKDYVLPKAMGFRPDFVLISAGFDAHLQDPLAQICLTTDFFGWMTDRALEIADRSCKGRVLSLLEGGYNLDVLPQCIALHLSRLLISAKPKV